MASYAAPIIFTADLHLDPGEPDRIAHFIRFTHFVAQCGAALYILGDLFNFWVGSAQARLVEYRPLLASLQYLSRSGRFTFLHGNRDFLFAPYWLRRGGKVIYDGTVLTGSTTSVVLYHGDAFCTGDAAFQRARRYYRKWWGYYLTSWLPAATCMTIGRRLRKLSQERYPLAVAPSAGPEVERRGADLACMEKLAGTGSRILICGHFHCREVLDLGGKTVTAYFLPESTGNTIHYLLWEDPKFTYRQFTA